MGMSRIESAANDVFQSAAADEVLQILFADKIRPSDVAVLRLTSGECGVPVVLEAAFEFAMDRLISEILAVAGTDGGNDLAAMSSRSSSATIAL